jgi:hypothetical protein
MEGSEALVELHWICDGEHRKKRFTEPQAKDMLKIAEKFEMEVLYNPICTGCVRKGVDCIGTKNWVWMGCRERSGVKK